MDKQRFHQLLSLASRHLAEAQQVIRQQEQIISDLMSKGADSREAQALLERLWVSADAMAAHQRSIEQQIQEFE
jgi:1,2-phenylacetyl-CoA epoxidase catalytic subunit